MKLSKNIPCPTEHMEILEDFVRDSLSADFIPPQDAKPGDLVAISQLHHIRDQTVFPAASFLYWTVKDCGLSYRPQPFYALPEKTQAKAGNALGCLLDDCSPSLQVNQKILDVRGASTETTANAVFFTDGLVVYNTKAPTDGITDDAWHEQLSKSVRLLMHPFKSHHEQIHMLQSSKTFLAGLTANCIGVGNDRDKYFLVPGK
jgi:hypothetical protein